MPRYLTLGNGHLLINYDANYQMRDLYFPHVGQENHLIGHVSKFGVWVGLPDGSQGRFAWISDGSWTRRLTYEPDTLLTCVTLRNERLGVALDVIDVVDFYENLLVRRFDITHTADHEQQVRLFFHHDFHILETEVGDTAYYEPLRRAVLHYKKDRWFLINGKRARADQEGVDQWATGVKEVHDQLGTWVDAEDGVLGGNPIAQGSVDSTVALHCTIEPGQTETVYYWLAVGKHFEDVRLMNHMIRERGPQSYIDRTRGYWKLWVNNRTLDCADLPEKVVTLFKQSLLIIRTQIDHSGAVIAANDYDITEFARDTYSYMWPRDGALVASALDMAGYETLTQAFFDFCKNAITPEGFLLHKYNPDGTLASSWHSWYRDGERQLPIQEDETGLVLWALWRHYERYRDIEWLSPLYRSLVTRAADWMAAYRDATGLPQPSWDLWEERRGVHAFSVGAIWAGLEAAAKFCTAFGAIDLAKKYHEAANGIKLAVDKYLFRSDVPNGEPRFVRMINHSRDESEDQEQPKGRGGVEAPGVRTTQEIKIQKDNIAWTVDWTLDSAMYGLWYFGMYAPDDPRIVSMMATLRARLWCQTDVGGMARYENDYYHQISQDVGKVPGNPWFICTMWLAQYTIASAKTVADLAPAVEILQWVADHALESGILAEQVNPYTHAPISVSPLTWSHATVVSAVLEYLEKRSQLIADGPQS